LTLIYGRVVVAVSGMGVTVSLGAGCVCVGGSGVALGAAVGWVQAVKARSRNKMRRLFRCFIWITLPTISYEVILPCPPALAAGGRGELAETDYYL